MLTTAPTDSPQNLTARCEAARSLPLGDPEVAKADIAFLDRRRQKIAFSSHLRGREYYEHSELPEPSANELATAVMLSRSCLHLHCEERFVCLASMEAQNADCPVVARSPASSSQSTLTKRPARRWASAHAELNVTGPQDRWEAELPMVTFLGRFSDGKEALQS